MRAFLREYGLWILIPLLFVLGGALLLYLWGGDEATTPIYSPF